METLTDKFIRYVSIDTQSNPTSHTYPSTKCQYSFLSMLKEELEAMGVHNVSQDEYGYVKAHIESNSQDCCDAIGFIAHVDTSPDVSGKDVKPQLIDYNGGDIVINKDLNIVLSREKNKFLDNYIGHKLIFSDGTTLLGADDKAGVAEIMSAVEYIINTPSLKHGDIYIAFTPDEEIGRGVDFFDTSKFGAKYAYTMDGGPLGEMEYENFNAASAEIIISGDNVHPGYAKDKMVNAMRIAIEIDGMIPLDQRPETTEGYEGFFHLTSIKGSVERCTMSYIIRDHSNDKFNEKKQLLLDIINSLSQKYNTNIEIDITDQYKNMLSVIEDGNMYIVDRAVKAMKEIGVKPNIRPIRGGTDGSRLSYMSLPCPNLFAGGELFHSKYEFISCVVMQKASELIIQIVKCNK